MKCTKTKIYYWHRYQFVIKIIHPYSLYYLLWKYVTLILIGSLNYDAAGESICLCAQYFILKLFESCNASRMSF